MALKNTGGLGLTRRQFLKEAGMTLGGAAIASLALSAGCAPGESSSVTANPAATSKTPAATATTPPDTASPPLTLLPVPGATVKVAAGRLYSPEHIWIEQGAANRVTLGITDKIQAIMEAVKTISLEPVGAAIKRNEAFGFIEGYKMNMDLICPVSGTIAVINPAMAEVKETEYSALNTDPYGKGWIMTLNLSNADELKDLLKAEEYVALTAVKEEAAH